MPRSWQPAARWHAEASSLSLDMSAALTYPEAIVVGAFQGVTELFPVSSLGHSILIPALVGGRWARDLSVSRPESPYLAFIVGLHVATAVARLVILLAGLDPRHRRVPPPCGISPATSRPAS